MEEPAFHKRHWHCVGMITDAARKIVQEAGGNYLPLPSGPGIPPLLLIMLPDAFPIFYDFGYHLEIGISDEARITLYSRNISQQLAEQSVEDLVISTPDEWLAVWDALGPSDIIN